MSVCCFARVDGRNSEHGHFNWGCTPRGMTTPAAIANANASGPVGIARPSPLCSCSRAMASAAQLRLND